MKIQTSTLLPEHLGVLDGGSQVAMQPLHVQRAKVRGQLLNDLCQGDRVKAKLGPRFAGADILVHFLQQTQIKRNDTL
jgi:hypothetical protein